MPRPPQTDQKRKELLPVVAEAFGELGYRRATTAELAQRCGVQENILYRLWPDKKAMFIAAIEYVYEQAAQTWRELLSENANGSDTAMKLLNYEADHYGEAELHRIIFAGLSETDEPQIREAMRTMYKRFHQFIRTQVTSHRQSEQKGLPPDETVSAWAIVGLANMANIGRELELFSSRGRRKMFADVGRLLLDGRHE